MLQNTPAAQVTVTNNLPTLDTVRGIAAATVAIWHWFSMARLSDPIFLQVNAIMYRASEIAVTTFFVLSGTVLTLAVLRDRSESEANLLIRYFVRRLFRIAPLAILVVTFAFFQMAVLRWALEIDTPWMRYSQFTFENWFWSAALISSHFNPPGWTLKLEVMAYVLLPFLVLAPTRPTRLGKSLHAGLFLGFAAIFVYLVTWSVFHEMMPMFLPGICLGLFIARPHFMANSALAMLAIGVLGLGILIQIELRHYQLAFLVASACACLVAYAALSDGMARAILTSSPLRKLGDISYGVYLWHYPTMFMLPYLLGSYVGTKDPMVFLATGLIGLPLTLMIASLSYRFFERPLMQFASRLASSLHYRGSPLEFSRDAKTES